VRQIRNARASSRERETLVARDDMRPINRNAALRREPRSPREPMRLHRS